MKRITLTIVFTTTFLLLFANNKDSVQYLSLPDSVKAISFLADISVSSLTAKKETEAGIQTNMVKLFLETDKKQRKIEFEFPDNAKVMTTGIGVTSEKGELNWAYNWSENENYKLMIAVASDSAGNFSLYSGYAFLPKENKWKLIGTCKIEGQWGTIKQPAIFFTKAKKSTTQLKISESWCQRNNGSWKNMMQTNLIPPVVNLLSHVDSLDQATYDIKTIGLSLQKTGPLEKEKDIYYQMMKTGTGRQVSINDTVVVYYKGYLLSDNSVFDETKDKPATFPLKRLITGWQIGLPLCKVGGKIKIIIPSGLAYSIRTRAAKIPPNSILVFEVEVVDARAPL
jgi:FKBP-type peptidyl-prolyl cis-trans isomerase FkpA